MSFDYSQSGLPDNKNWKAAAEICHQWVNRNMGAMFGPERIANFMKNQPVAAAQRVMNNCDNWSEESITLLLLGPAKGMLVANAQVEAVSRRKMGERTIDLLKTLEDSNNALDADMVRDARRIYLAEAVSAMSDQLINRHLAKSEGSRFQHHDVRKKMLKEFQENFATLKGADPKLDAVFEDALQKSKVALDAIDLEMAVKKKSLKPPGL